MNRGVFPNRNHSLHIHNSPFLTHSFPVPLSKPPGNIRKAYGFLMFSGGRKKGALGTNGLMHCC